MARFLDIYRLFILLVFAAVLASGCSAVQRIPSDEGSARGYLRLDVEPGDAEIYIDSEFQGVVEGWVANTLVLPAGPRRVELRGEGYITRRFDVELAPGQEIELSVRMEPELDQVDDFNPEGQLEASDNE